MNFLPALSQADVSQVASLIQASYTPGQPFERQRQYQQEIFEIQKRPEAWGLVAPFLQHEDNNVQFFGAHTAQVKIARDWASIPPESVEAVRDFVLDVTASAVAARRGKITLRKLYVAITSLGLKLAIGHPPKWQNWILETVTLFSSRGASDDQILDFLSIAAEEVESSDLVPISRAQIRQSLLDAVPVVTQSVRTCIQRLDATSSQLHSAFKCYEAWIPIMCSDDITSFIPVFISLLSSELAFVGASDALQEILTRSPLSDGAGSKTITEPLLLYLENGGAAIVKQTISTGSVDDASHSLCKLLVTLGEHSINYVAANISMPRVQHFLQLVLAYTALPGWYGVEEEESEMTLSFWYLLQEALWSVDFVTENQSINGPWAVATALYRELVVTLKRKVTWPPRDILDDWARDERERFQVYRRDVGDTLINAYYVLRDEMLRILVTDLSQQLANHTEQEGWENVEANLHCLMSIQEAVPAQADIHLSLLFGPQILGMLPSIGYDRVRKTTLGLIGAYSSWFTTQSEPALLLGSLNYVVQALAEPQLCFSAANALRDLCDANRTALAPHIAAFGQLHANLELIADMEKTKVIQSIASVIQALPPEEEIQPVEAIISPVVAKLVTALEDARYEPEESRAIAIQQLHIINGCAKGLTRAAEIMFVIDETSPDDENVRRLELARNDPRIVKLRTSILEAIRGIMELWSFDALTSDALSELFKSITALPSDTTLLALPPGPLLQLVCGAMQRNLNGVWLSLSNMLILQLDPPSMSSLKAKPSPEADALVAQILPVLLEASLGFMSQEGAMEENTDIVQSFFGCMDTVAQHFLSILFRLPAGAFTALIECAVEALNLQERYSLVSASNFLVSLINLVVASDEFAEQGKAFVQAHGKPIMRAVLCGFTGMAPASTVQNLIDLLSTMVSKLPAESKVWMPEILFSDDFAPSKADNAAKERFVKTVLGTRSAKKTREAAQQFTLIAKGLEGSSFGYASITM